jgi:uncharacterized membrane protein
LDSSLELEARQRRTLAAATVILSLGWGLTTLGFLQPYFTEGRVLESSANMRFARYGSTPREILITWLTSPGLFVGALSERLLNLSALRYVAWLFGPYAFFYRFGGAWWLFPAAAGALMNLLPDYDLQRTMEFHYELAILPFLIAAALTGIRNRGPKKIALLGLVVALCFSGRWPGRAVRQEWPSSTASLREAWFLRTLPDTEITAAGPRALAQLSRVRELRLVEKFLPTWKEQAHAIAMDTNPRNRRLATDAIRYVLDLSEPVQKALSEDMLRAGFSQEATSPGGTLLVLRRPRREAP